MADLAEDEGVELVGADSAFPATAVGTAGPEGVVVGAVVVAVDVVLGRPGLVGMGPHPAGPADDEPAQQPQPWCGAPGREDRVVTGGGLHGGKDLFRNDRRDGDFDPFLLGAETSPLFSVVGDVVVAVPNGGARISTVVQQPGDGRGPPQSLPGRGRGAVFVEVTGDLA